MKPRFPLLLLLLLLLLPLLCHCYSSFTPGNGPGGSDASAADDGAIGDSFLADGVDPSGDGSGIEPYVPAPLRNTIWVMHDDIIEERRIDDFSVILDTQPLLVEETSNHRTAITSTEHGCLVLHDERIDVYDRRTGWSVYSYPEGHRGSSSNFIIRDGYWLMSGGQRYREPNGRNRRQRRRFQIETGRFELFEYLGYSNRFISGDLGSWADGLDGHVTEERTSDLRTWLYADGYLTLAREYLRVERGPLRGYNRRLMMRDGSAAIYRGAGRRNTWTLLGRDHWDYFVRHERHDWFEPYHGGILPTADDELFFITREDVYNNGPIIEVTIRKTTAEFDDAEIVFGPVRWGKPVRMALGDPVQRIANTPR